MIELEVIYDAGNLYVIATNIETDTQRKMLLAEMIGEEYVVCPENRVAIKAAVLAIATGLESEAQ